MHVDSISWTFDKIGISTRLSKKLYWYTVSKKFDSTIIRKVNCTSRVLVKATKREFTEMTSLRGHVITHH